MEKEDLLAIVTWPALEEMGEVIEGKRKAYKNYDVLCRHPGRNQEPILALIFTEKGKGIVTDSAGYR
jgi:hypothetical protein